jgi:predicted permease
MIEALGYAFRHLRRSPGFALTAVLSLAFGIGANGAMFALINALMLRPLPVREPQRLIRIAGMDAQGRMFGLRLTLLDLIRREQMFDGVCGFLTPLATTEIEGRIEQTSMLAMTGDCFETLGVIASTGRVFGPADDTAGAKSVTVLTYDEWQRQFGGRPNVLGQTLTIEGSPSTIVGVSQRGFRGVLLGFPTRILYPMTVLGQYLRASSQTPSSSYSVYVFARLKSGESSAQVTSRLQTTWSRLLDLTVPSEYQPAQRARYLRQRLSVVPAATGIDYVLRPRFERPLVAVLAIAAFVLSVACVNVANLLLERAVYRRREMAIRLALGAGRGTLIRTALAESVVLLSAGVTVGLLLAYWGDRFLVSVLRVTYPGFDVNVAPDPRSLSFACASAASAFLLFAIAPAWKQSRAEALLAMNNAPGRIASESTRLPQVLMVVQVALTLALVTGATLFATTFSRLRTAPLGLNPESVLAAQLSPMPGGYQNHFSPAVYYPDLLQRVASTPGVRAAALSQMIPLSSQPQLETVGLAGVDESQVQAEMAIVSDGFLSVMGISLIAGKDFGRGESSDGSRTAIVSESLARTLFGTGNPVGQRIRVGVAKSTSAVEIVGVARDAVLSNPKSRNTSVAYVNLWQSPDRQQWSGLQVRTMGDPGSIAGAVRREYPSRIDTLLHERDASLVEERLLATLSVAFGGLALILAAVGLYGLIAFSVAQRTNEIGIRMALGAERGHVVSLVLREAGILILIGIFAGLPITWLGSRAIGSLLFGISPFDLTAITSSIALLAITGTVAAFVPARRAASVAPVQSLRYE